jgi:hypothetical protein
MLSLGSSGSFMNRWGEPSDTVPLESSSHARLLIALVVAGPFRFLFYKRFL